MNEASKYEKLRIKAFVDKRYAYADDNFKELKCKFLEDYINKKLNV